MADYVLQSTWEDVDAAAQAVANGLQKSQLSQSVQTSLDHADSAYQSHFWVNITRSNNVYSSDKTLSEIQAAYAAGKYVRANLPDGFQSDFTNNDSGAMFYAFDDSGGSMVLMRYTVGASSVVFQSWPVGQQDSFTEEFKQALLACFNNVAWATPDGQSLVDDLEASLYPEVHLVSITAAYDQDHPIYSTDTWEDACATIALDLTVTAHLSDGTDEVLSASDYTLTGTLAVGTITVTVGYEGKTAEISVLVLDGTLLFSVSNATIDKTSNPAISSGVNLLSEDRDFTILFDGTQPSAIATGSNTRLMWCAAESTGWKGIMVGTNTSGTKYGMEWYSGQMPTASQIFLRNASNARFRFAYVHTKSSGTCDIYCKLNSNAVQKTTLTGTFVAQQANLIFGGPSTSSNGQNWIGTLTSGKVYSRVLTQSELDAFFA